MNASAQNLTKGGEYRSFEDLEVYKTAREFRVAMYRVAKTLPDFEKFGLASQMRRAALSVTNNLAEGHGRFHFLDQIKFVLISRGSLEELMDDMNVCSDESELRYLIWVLLLSFSRNGTSASSGVCQMMIPSL